MIGLLVCFGGLLAAGLFFLAADLLRLPYLKTSKAMINTGRENRKAAKSLETYLLSLAVKLAPYIHMDEYKRGRQKNILKASGLNMEPEVYQAYVISKAGLVLLGGIPCLLVFPLLAVIVVVLAVMVYFKEQERADELLAKKRGELEGELPRFVSTIEQEQRELKDRAAALQEELSKSQAATVNAEKFMGIVRKHLAFEELTPTLLREMIEKIVVHECSYDENGIRRQDIEIYYSFVGKIDLPEA